MQDLTIALLQFDIIWHHPQENRSLIEKKINQLTSPCDLLILPEMFTTGFSMHPTEIYETMDGVTLRWIKELASSKKIAIAGSLCIKENDSFFNRFFFVTPNGNVKTYDKRHLFTLAGEHLVYKAGTKTCLIHYNNWVISPFICYDLRFPVWSRNRELYDLAIYVANWPSPRINAWDTLLKARATENMSYVVGVNRIGKDANNHEYPGHSKVFDELGTCIVDTNPSKEGLYITTLSKKALENSRSKLKFLNDQDSFSITPS